MRLGFGMFRRPSPALHITYDSRSGEERITLRTYRAAGVDIDAGNALVERIKPIAAATARTGANAALGGFGAFFDLDADRQRVGEGQRVAIHGGDGVARLVSKEKRK